MRSLRPESTLALLLTVIAVTLGGCAESGPSFVVPANTQAVPQANLETLFEQIATQVSSAKPGSTRAIELNNQLAVVGGELAQRAAATARTRLSAVGRVDGQIPLGALEREIGGLETIQRYSPSVHDQLQLDLQREFETTRSAIDAREGKLAALGDNQTLERLNLLSELSALAGTGSEQQLRYAAQRDAILKNVSQEAEEAIRNEDYEKAQGLLGIVQEVNPEDSAARKKKCEVDGKVLSKRFSQTLESGRVGGSAQMLQEFSETDCFDEIREQLSGSAASTAEAFAMLGQEAAASGRLGLAYERYRDAHVIQKLLLGQTGSLGNTQSFVAKVDRAFQKAYDGKQYGLALGFLSVLTDFGEITPKLRQRVRQTREEVTRRAVRGVTAYPFADSPTSAAKVGDAVASKVVQYIFQTIPSDVRIVEREQLERILGECERVGNCSDLDTADFIVQGSILDAKVETTEKVSNETRRVVTGNEAVVNPDHVRWSQLSDRERKKTTEPPRTVSRDVTEDVTIQVTNVRKVGIISVSYRVIEANSGRVLFTDSIQTKQEFQDDGRQGIQLGNFMQETDFVELPPDIEILSGNEGLADKISAEIGGKLVDFLQNPEAQYSKEAKRFENEGDFVAAATRAAYALILAESKDAKNQNELRETLKRYAMASAGA